MSKLILEAETHRILGACFEVYKEKGCGFVEPVYQECLWSEAILDGQFRTARLSQRRSFLVCFRVLLYSVVVAPTEVGRCRCGTPHPPLCTRPDYDLKSLQP